MRNMKLTHTAHYIHFLIILHYFFLIKLIIFPLINTKYQITSPAISSATQGQHFFFFLNKRSYPIPFFKTHNKSLEENISEDELSDSLIIPIHSQERGQIPSRVSQVCRFFGPRATRDLISDGLSNGWMGNYKIT